MMKFIKRKWFPSVAVLAGILVVASILFFCGFRITYAPELENSWDAISAVAAWAGVIASFIAIWFAIQVPKKIADRQDRIALFEKRIACFAMLELQRNLYFSIKDEIDVENIKHSVAVICCTDSLRDFNKISFLSLVDKLGNQCTQMAFLFDGIEYKEANELGLAFGKFIAALYNTDKERVMAAKMDYLKKIDDFINKHLEEMSRCLFVSK